MDPALKIIIGKIDYETTDEKSTNITSIKNRKLCKKNYGQNKETRIEYKRKVYEESKSKKKLLKVEIEKLFEAIPDAMYVKDKTTIRVKQNKYTITYQITVIPEKRITTKKNTICDSIMNKKESKDE